MINFDTLILFATESNKIEGITGLQADVVHAYALEKLLLTPRMFVIADVDEFVHDIQPDAQIRIQPGLDVSVGNHYPPRGGPMIQSELINILYAISNNTKPAYHNHHHYETLHPFTDGNGRSGRALWLWQMHKYEGYKGQRLFLHQWYYDSLNGWNSNTD